MSPHRRKLALRFVTASFGLLQPMLVQTLWAQTAAPTNNLPNPYREVDDHFRLPDGRKWGQVPTADIDSKGHIWVLDRCGGTGCVGSMLDPVLEFDASGKLLKSFGRDMFVFPHGLFVDKDDNIWTTDGQGKDGKGQQAIKFDQDGMVLMRLGKAGVAGTGPDTFNRPSDVAVAPNGDIFVADGHGGDDSNARIVKFTKDGKFIKTWGKVGTAPGEFDAPHSLAFDSQGRLFVADRGNNRIQIFEQDGKFLDQWKQFSRPTGVFINKRDTLLVSDSDSDSERNPGWKRGIRIGSAKTGKVEFLIPYEGPEPKPGSNGPPAEGVMMDAKGNVYGAEVAIRAFKMYVKK